MLSIYSQPQRLCRGWTRREVLTIGSLGLGGLALGDLLRAESAQGLAGSRKAIIMIYLCGAPPHQDMFDLKMEAPAEIRGDFRPIPTNVPGIQICEHLPRLARIMDKLVPLRTVYGSPSGDHDSFICYTGRTVRQQPPGGWPSVGSTLAKLQGTRTPGIPPLVGLAPPAGHPPYGSPGHPGFLGPAYRAFTPNADGKSDLTLSGISVERLQDRKQLLTEMDRLRRDVDAGGAMQGHDAFTQQALDVLTSSRLAAALDITREDPQTRERYGHGDPNNYGDGARATWNISSSPGD